MTEYLPLIGALISFLLTIMVLFYIFGDNAVFRLAIYIFIGVAAGYTAAVVLRSVIMPHLAAPLVATVTGLDKEQFELSSLILKAVLVILLLFKLSPKTARLGNPATAFLVGVGAAVVIAGAVQGTLFPQITGMINLFGRPETVEAVNGEASALEHFLSAFVVLIGTVSTLAYFHFSARSFPGKTPTRPAWIRSFSKVGEVFIAVTFGVLFAGVFKASLTALIERMFFLADDFWLIIQGFLQR